MPALIKNGLHTQLLQYKKAGPTARHAIIDEIIQSIDALPKKIMNKSEAAVAYKTMVHAATRLNYASSLQTPQDEAFGKLNDKYIGQILPTEKGQYHFTSSHEGPLTLADCQLQRISTENSSLQNILDAYLVTEHDALFETAKKYYDDNNADVKMDRIDFIKVLKQCLSDDAKFPADIHENKGLGLEQLREDLQTPLKAAETNSDILPSDVLKDMIQIIKRFVPNGDEAAQKAQRQLLSELKARLQIDTFKLLPVYNDILDHIKPFLTTIKIDNFFDSPHDVGTQTYSVISMKQSFDHLFMTFMTIPTSKSGTDLQGDNMQRLTLLGALAKFNLINSSHLLAILASQLDRLKAASLRLGDVWLLDEYNAARLALETKAHSIKTIETDVEKSRQKELTEATSNLDRAFKDKDVAHKAALEPLLNQLKAEITALNDSGQENTQTLISALNNTKKLLNKEMLPKDYEITAEAMKGHAWSNLYALHNIMLALSLVVVTLGIIAVATPLTAAAAIPVATALCEFGLFMMNRPTGLSKAALNLATEATKLADAPTPGQPAV